MSTVLNFVQSTKICNSCKEPKPFTSFTKNKASPDGLQYKCRSCDVAYQAKRRVENPQKRRDYEKQYLNTKRQDFDFRLNMLLNASKQRARNKNREHTITVEDIKAIYPTDGCCPIFGMKLEFNTAGFRENSPSIDRIDTTKGYTPDNIQIISWKANRIKGYATLQELEMLLAYLTQGE
jgi:hypothetical protein